jgi:hypothetical protein
LDGAREQHTPPLLSSATSNDTGDSGGMTAEKWFDRSNKRPGVGLQPTFDDGMLSFIYTPFSFVLIAWKFR